MVVGVWPRADHSEKATVRRDIVVSLIHLGVADGERSVILAHVTFGIAVRMAVMSIISAH